MQISALRDLGQRAETELRSDILPFWLTHTIDRQHGGFYGQISNDLTVNRRANKGLTLNARILSTFARAHRAYGDVVYRRTAERAYEYLMERFRDRECGGFYSAVSAEGHPVDTHKRVCAHASCIYALTEYHFATGHAPALAEALRTYHLLEAFTRDKAYGGYFEAFGRGYTRAEDSCASTLEASVTKSANTHLHVVESYAHLVRASGDPEVRERVGELIRIFIDRIVDASTGHLRLGFDEAWTPRSHRMSFGHDIEASWLLVEAVETLGDPALLSEVRALTGRMAEAVLARGVDTDGGVFHQADPAGIVDGDKHGWAQAEAVVGFLEAYEVTKRVTWLEAATRTWSFVERTVLDLDHGEWFWKVSREGVPSPQTFKVDDGKCPYHNSRACLEVMARTERLARKAEAHGPSGRVR